MFFVPVGQLISLTAPRCHLYAVIPSLCFLCVLCGWTKLLWGFTQPELSLGILVA